MSSGSKLCPPVGRWAWTKPQTIECDERQQFSGEVNRGVQESCNSFRCSRVRLLGVAEWQREHYESMGFRVPEREDFELYLRKTVRYRSAFREDDGEIKVFNRPEVPAWDDFRSSEDAGCLRKLWTLAHQVSKKEVEALATGAEDDQKNKITMATAQELEEDAVRAGGFHPQAQTAIDLACTHSARLTEYVHALGWATKPGGQKWRLER